jgi:hypothetical protein
MGYYVDKQLMYEPHTEVAWQDTHGRYHIHLSYSTPTPSSKANRIWSLIMSIAVTRVDAVVRLCVTPVAQPQESVPAAGMEGCSLVTMAVSSKRFRNVHCHYGFRPLIGLCENYLEHFDFRGREY